MKNTLKNIGIFIIVMCLIIFVVLLIYFIKCDIKEGIVSLSDEFKTIYGNTIFNIYSVNKNDNVILFDDISIGFITAYHFKNPQETIDILRQKYTNIYIIIVDGEPLDLTNTTPDMIISTKHEKKYFPSNIPIIYVPYFAYLFRQNLNISHLNLLVKTNFIEPVKQYFCAFITSNCSGFFKGVKMRLDFFKLLEKRTGRVHSLGKCLNNFPSESIEKDNINILKPYKFCICFENEDRYNSEKIIYPIIANCIPIYYGSSIYRKFFNPKRIIDVNDYDSFDSCIDYILQVDSDDDLYKSIINEPFLKDNKIDKNLFSFSFGKGDCFKTIYNNLPLHIRRYTNFNSLYNNNIHFITFADGKNYKTNRIMKEASDSRYFDVCKDMSSNIDDFITKHQNFINQNKRGYGFYIWKHKAIIEEYKILKDDDILVWCDSGNTIVKFNTKFLDYMNTLINKSGMLFFNIKYKEISWNKMDLVNTIFNNDNDYINDILNKHQTTASIMMFRKCDNTTLYLNEVEKHSNVYHNLNDDPSIIPNRIEYKEHRHDQSIFSLIKYKYNFDTTDDNFDDSPATPSSNCKCFISSRKKT